MSVASMPVYQGREGAAGLMRPARISPGAAFAKVRGVLCRLYENALIQRQSEPAALMGGDERMLALMFELALLFVVVFGLNVLPAFAPPTWLAMSAFGFQYPGMPTALVASVAAAGATCGRLLLACFAGRIMQSRFVRDAMRENLAVVAHAVRQRRAMSLAVVCTVAFSPVASNVLFLAYGLTRARLRLLAVLFFLGRFTSYAAAFAGGAMVSRYFESQLARWGAWLLIPFVLGQVALLGLVYAFAKVDWRKTREESHLRWLGRR